MFVFYLLIMSDRSGSEMRLKVLMNLVSRHLWQRDHHQR